MYKGKNIFKFLINKIRIRLYKNRKSIYSDTDKKIFRLVRKTLRQENSEIFMSVEPDRYFAVDKKNNISILVGYSKIKISNHNYFYEIFLDNNAYNYLVKLFGNKIKQKRDEFENEVFNNKNSFLDKLINL